jgi:hypothetical protein
MGAILALILLVWTAAAWFSGPYGRAFLGVPVFGAHPLIPFSVFILCSLVVFYWWLRRHGSTVWEKANQYLRQQRKTVIILCCILAFHLLAVSGPAILNYWGENDSDTALHGLPGYHIAEGSERPMYIYGAHYVGLFKAHIAALFNFLFGKSPIYQRAIGAAFYMGFLVGLFIFVRRLFDEKTALLATFLAAILPFAAAAQLRYDEFVELPLWGIIGLNLLLSLTHEKQNNWKYYFWYGVVLGVQFFAHPQAIYFIAAGFLVIFAVDKLFFLRRRNWLIPLGFIIGTIPTWIDSYFHDWVIFRVFFGDEVHPGGPLLERLAMGISHFARNFTEFWGVGPMYPLPFPVPPILVTAVMAAAITGFIYYAWIARKEIRAFLAFKRSSIRLLIPLVLGMVVLVIFCFSSQGAGVAPFRYIYVLWMVIPIVIAASATVPKSKWGKVLGRGFLAVSLVLFSLSQFSYFKNTLEVGQRWQRWFNFCHQGNITHFYGDFWLAYHTNFISKEEIIGSSCFPFNNDPYTKYREMVDHSPKPPAYVFSPQLWANASRIELQFQRELEYLGIRYTRQMIDRHVVFYNLSEHLTPAQMVFLPTLNRVAYEGFSFREITGGEFEDFRLLTLHCRNMGRNLLYVDGKRAAAELVVTAPDGTVLRRQPLEKNVPPDEAFQCQVLLSFREMKNQPVYIHVKLNDIIISANKQPFILRPADLETTHPGNQAGDINISDLYKELADGKLPVFMLINGWGQRWCGLDQVLQWSGGKQCEIAFLVKDPAKPHIVELLLEPFHDRLFQDKQQSLLFYLNNEEIEEQALATPRKIQLNLPPGKLRLGLNRLTIKPRLVEPVCRNIRRNPGFNYRPRAFALRSMRFL